MDENNDGKIDKWEYLLHQLIQQVSPAPPNSIAFKVQIMFE